MSHKLIVFTAPSGAGKTTLVKHLIQHNKDLQFSVSATTRTRRPNEVDGQDYYFIGREEFLRRRANNEFLEWQEVYDGNFYGTLLSEIQRIFALNKSVLFDVDVKGALNIKKHYGNLALTVFVRPPSIEVLRDRLLGRNTETNASLLQRLDKAIQELEYEPCFDTCIVNDNLDIAKKDAETITHRFLSTDAGGFAEDNKPAIYDKVPPCNCLGT